MNTAVFVRAAEKKALPKKFMRSDKSSQMRVFYVGLIVEGVNEDITPGQELEEEIRCRGGKGGGAGGRQITRDPRPSRCSASEDRETYTNTVAMTWG